MSKPFDTHRRTLLRAALAGTAAAAAAPWPRLSLAGTTRAGDSRFVMVILRGGMDGLYAVPAVGDPDFAAARGPLAHYAEPALKLGGPFALHPALAQLHAMYGRGEATVVHAVGLPYRERSHFDAQQVLESGGTRPFELSTGWLGRALGPAATRSIALATTVPLLLRGNAPVDTWAPSNLPDPSADLVVRLERLYGSDPALASALARAKALHFDPAMMAELSADTDTMAGGTGRRNSAFVLLARRAAEFLSAAGGPRAAVLELGGFDSHANEAATNGATTNSLRQLDAGLAALREGLLAGQAWRHTVVVVATEFGREVAVNGTQGTDHGSGGAAFVLGGAVKGGQVIADWPGLAKRDRFEGRDLRTTTDLRAVLKGVLADHLQVAGRAIEADVFPGSAGLRVVPVLA